MTAKITLKQVQLPNGETIGYREREGSPDGPLLVLVHGNMNSSQHWDLLLEQLDARLRLLAVDLPGFGISSYNRPISGLGDYAEQLELFADALGLTSFSLIGWSMGGGVVMQYAADHPERVERLILLSSVSTRGYPFFADGADGQPDLSRRLRTAEEARALSRTRMIDGAAERRDREFMRWLFDAAVYNVGKPPAERYETYIDDILTQRNLADIYHALNTFNISGTDHDAAPGSGDVDRIQAPVLVIWGKQDLVIQEWMTRELVNDLGPRATLVELEACGHSALVDALPALTSEVERFVLGGGKSAAEEVSA
ncbi:alpha/beta fold hydrolase [Paenibacillus chartarius]|uniref:Alpha/beta fold hydrolase n=1 Tax=Paenibacillus chartarius TaxID=747481 RepID=A0ABV6DFL6_9BACL